jgi:hypothetical protein
MRHFPLRECGYAIGGLVLLLALYVGAYFLTVSRIDRPDWAFEKLDPPDPRIESIAHQVFHGEADYPIAANNGSDVVRAFFRPIHEADRRLRPDFWNDREPPESWEPMPPFLTFRK